MELEWVASEKAAAKRARAAQRKAAARRRSGQPQSMGGGQRASERGKQQLHRACAEGDLEVVRLLLLDETAAMATTEQFSAIMDNILEESAYFEQELRHAFEKIRPSDGKMQSNWLILESEVMFMYMVAVRAHSYR